MKTIIGLLFAAIVNIAGVTNADTVISFNELKTGPFPLMNFISKGISLTPKIGSGDSLVVKKVGSVKCLALVNHSRPGTGTINIEFIEPTEEVRGKTVKGKKVSIDIINTTGEPCAVSGFYPNGKQVFRITRKKTGTIYIPTTGGIQDITIDSKDKKTYLKGIRLASGSIVKS